MIIKILIKTRPLKQWEVKREMLRRTKNRFDKLDIEIPFPHLTLFLRSVPVGCDPTIAMTSMFAPYFHEIVIWA